MLKDYTILLLDTAQTRCNELAIILKFLGYSTIIANEQGWQQQVEHPDRLLAIILGQGDVKNFKSSFIDWKYNTPFLAIEGIITEPNLLEKIYVELRYPFKHAQLLDVFHHCQICLEEDESINKTEKQHSMCLFQSLVGTSPQISNVRKMITQVSSSETSVLILGESGSGKEIVARNLHDHSSRSAKPFVPINCGAIPGELLESELFGHEKGAFTGAINARQGRFELAKGGTLFLDEVGDMPLSMQVKLLRILQERCFERVGSNTSIKADVRIIAATHRDLEKEIANGKFREDLYYRLNVFPIEMPSLRERVQDISILLHELTAKLEEQTEQTLHFLPDAVAALSRYSWPGNVRELANLVERLAILYPNGVIDVNELPAKFRGQSKKNTEVADVTSTVDLSICIEKDFVSYLTPMPKERFDLKEHLVKTELALIRQALDQNGGVVARAADYLSIRRTTLVEKMRKYGMHRDGTVSS